MGFLRDLISNRNVHLLATLIFILGLFVNVFQWNLWNGAIESSADRWAKTLKFDSSNSKEFGYSIKTQQGDLFASGNLYAADKPLTNDLLDGEYLSIEKVNQEYRSHQESYSCRCKTDSDGDRSCDTCWRTVWEWEYAGSEESKVGRVKLLDYEMDASTVPWSCGWQCSTKMKNGDTYHKTDRLHRFYFNTTKNGLEWSGGFTSNDKGFNYDSGINKPSDTLVIVRWIVTIMIFFGFAAGIIYFIAANYEENDQML